MKIDRSGWKALGLALSAISLLLGGCGKRSKDPAETASSAPRWPQAISFQIVVAGDDPALPATDLESRVLPLFIEDRGETFLKKAVQISGKRPLFFVWSEEGLGSPIRDATYEHRVENPNNKTLGTPDRHPVSFDRESRRWFIPISRLLPASELEIDPAEIHHLVLDLFLKDGARREFKILFRTSGPLPAVKPHRLGLDGVGAVSVYLSEGAQSGFVVNREEWCNPSKGALVIQVTKSHDSTLHLSSILAFGRYQALPSEPPRGPFPEYYESRTVLDLNQVRVFAPGEASRVFALRDSEPVRILLRPLQKVVLEYRAGRAAQSQTCVVPSATIRHIGWVTDSSRCFGRGECVDGTRYFSRDVQESWSLAGASIQGELPVDVRLSQDRDPGEEPSDEPAVGSAEIGARSVGFGIGILPAHPAPHSCNGLF